MQTEIYYDILSNKQREILPCLGFLKERQIYLAGGTALALQIGHRSSIDFDFYDKTEFELDKILRQFRHFFKNVSVIQMSNRTLIVDVEGIQVSVFYYDYKVIRPFLRTKRLLLLSLEDISAMKLIAITLALQKCLSKTSFVIPAKAGIQGGTKRLDSRFRGNDRKSQKV